MNIAINIINQLGGRIQAMLGATAIINHGNGLSFKFKGCRKYNYVHITLEPSDLYTMRFARVTRLGDVTKEESFHQVYNTNLQEIFENTTGLHLTL